MKPVRILVLDDRHDIENRYSIALTGLSAQLILAPDIHVALEQLGKATFDLVVVAVRSGRADGIDAIPALHAVDPQLPVVVVAEVHSVEIAAASRKLGADEYLPEAAIADSLADTARELLKRRRVRAEHEFLRRQVERPYGFDDFIGTSPAMRKVFQTIEQVAASNVDVLVTGETGTGKELIARSIHRRSLRAQGPFVPVDCGAIPENLLESEFFGHEQGAFTGAASRRIGLLEFAEGGTFFLDELGELPPVLQAKLLRTLQERKVRRVGGREELDIDVRIVAATARDLEAMVRSGHFRQDLYYRINVVRIELPPLRARGDDIGLLAESFAYRHGREMAKSISGITPEAYQVLAQYAWPGNVRELQNVTRRALALSRGTMIGLNDLPDEVVAAAGQRTPIGSLGYFQLRDQHVAKFERQYLTELLARHGGDVKAAADEAKLPRGTLYRLMKNHDLDAGKFK